MAEVETEENQQPRHQANGNAQPRLEESARGTNLGHHGRRKQQAAGEAAEMGHVVNIQAGMDQHIAAANR